MLELTTDEARYEKYIDAGLKLIASGERPSGRAMIKLVGGSMTTANEALPLFWGYIQRRIAFDEEYPDGTPDAVKELAQKCMALARVSAKAELEASTARLDIEWKLIGDERIATTEKIHQLSESLLETQQRLSELQHIHDSTLRAHQELQNSHRSLLEKQTNDSLLALNLESQLKLVKTENSDLRDQILTLTTDRRVSEEKLDWMKQSHDTLKTESLTKIESVTAQLSLCQRKLDAATQDALSATTRLTRTEIELAACSSRVNASEENIKEFSIKAAVNETRISSLIEENRKLYNQINKK